MYKVRTVSLNFGVLEECRLCRDSRLQPINFPAEQMMRCNLPLSLAVAAVGQMVKEEVRMDSVMAVLKCSIIDFGRLTFFSCHRITSSVVLSLEVPGAHLDGGTKKEKSLFSFAHLRVTSVLS